VFPTSSDRLDPYGGRSFDSPVRDTGEAVQVEPMESKLKTPGAKRLKPYDMTKWVKPLGHLERLSAKSYRSTNQNAPFGRLSTTGC
jgi:hypothetical protein